MSDKILRKAEWENFLSKREGMTSSITSESPPDMKRFNALRGKPKPRGMGLNEWLDILLEGSNREIATQLKDEYESYDPDSGDKDTLAILKWYTHPVFRINPEFFKYQRERKLKEKKEQTLTEEDRDRIVKSIVEKIKGEGK